jgi:multiple sugar transport system permease protein
MNKKVSPINMLLFHLLVISISFVMIYPLIWMFFSSFKDSALVLTTIEQLFPSEWKLNNYYNGWSGFGGTSFEVFFKNSFIVTTLSVIGNVLVSSMAAYGFSRIKFKGRNVLFVCMLITMMLPAQVLIIPQYIIFSKLDWVNTFLPLVVPEWGGRAFFIFLIIQFMAGIPSELDEAAKIDGCDRIKLYTRIMLPLIRPALVTCAVFAFYWKWDDFMGSLLYLNTPEKYTVSIALKLFADPTSVSDYGALFAMCILSLLPVIILFLVLQKYIVEGIATSGLKG